MIDCLLTGKKTSDLKKILQERFNVSYSRADSIVRTEMAHIQTQAAQKRYEDSGIKEVEIWADEDERRCDVCGKLHQKRLPIGAKMPIPAHPNCRCSIIPVVEEEKDNTETIMEQPKKMERRRNIEEFKIKKALDTPNFSGMDKSELEVWSKANLKAKINYSGSSIDAARTTTKALYTLEKQGFNIDGLQIEYGNTGSSYGLFNRNTKVLRLRKNSSFVDKMKELDLKATMKYGKPYYANSSYEGALYHEIGHALDDLNSHAVSIGIASNEKVFREAIQVSYYAAERPHDIRANKATETIAECFSAYMTDGGQKEKIPREVIEWIERYFKKK